MSVWESKTLGDLERESGGTIQTGPFGSQLHMSDYSDAGTPVVMPTNIRDLRIDPTGIARVSNEHVERLRRHKLRAGDIVYSRRGDVEKCALITKHEEGWLCGTGCILVRVQGPNLNARFLTYLLSRPETRTWISQHAVGATMPNLNTEILREVPVDVPDVKTQRAIAATLGALDDKIESNRRLMAKADDLFHAMWRRVYNALPQEAEVPLSEHVTTQYGLTASASAEVSGDRFLRVTDINKKNWIEWSVVPSAPVDDAARLKYSLSKGDLLVARMADPGKSAIFDGGPPAVFASYLVRLKPRSYEEALFLYGFLKSSFYAEYSAGAMTGSVQKNMNAKVIVGASVRWPEPTALSSFAAQGAPLRAKISQLVEENARLTTLRDTLLPELLSGRLRVPVREAAA